MTRYVFTADDGSNGEELWVTDGTTAGTVLLKDVNPGANGFTTLFGAFFARLGDGRVIFTADNGASGAEIWVTDGTAGGTVKLKTIDAGFSQTFGLITDVTSYQGKVVFSAGSENGAHRDLWITDGTAAGTVKFQSPNPSGRSNPTDVTVVGDKLFFSATDGTHGAELWVSSGVAGDARMVKDISSTNSDDLGPSDLFAFGNKLLFTAADAAHGGELWISDGTSGGTVMVKDIRSGAVGSTIHDFTQLGGKVLFEADDGSAHGSELWITDGTASGTVLLKDIYPGGQPSSPSNIVTLGSKAVFEAADASNGRELWVTDGTATGTMRVKDIDSGSGDGLNQSGLTRWGNKAVFAAADGAHGREIWVTDGTAAGTSMLKDINSGAGDSTPGAFVVLTDGRLSFSADDGVHGREIWVSDGTANGTVLLRDINGANSGVQVGYLTQVGASSGGGAAPTDISLSKTTVAEAAANNTVIGALSATDPDAGDSFTYALAAASSVFAISGSNLVVQNGLLLDYEQAASQPVSITVTDAQGHSFTKAFTIGVTDVNPETITGDAGANKFVGGAGADSFTGAAGADTLIGGGGADTLVGGQGNDSLVGGAGNDSYYLISGEDAAHDSVVEGVNGGTDTVYTNNFSYKLTANVENLTFIDASLHFARGNDLSNLIRGNAGQDRFVMDAGGNDTFSGGSGEDAFDGRASSIGLTLRLDDQTANAGGVAGDLFASVERFFGSDTAGDAMTTGAARAKFSGFGGDDTLTGGSSIDALSGGAGNDSLVGNGGQDALDGGTGNDTMTGGAARDTFTFIDAAFGKDVVTDFEDGIDRLKIFSAVADSFSDFTVTGNGTHHVVLTLNAATANTITLDNASANITISAADFLFY